MERFHHDTHTGDAKREYSAGFGDSEQLLQQHYRTLRRSRSTPTHTAPAPAPAAVLPGFATFLQQSPPRHEHNSVAQSRQEHSSLSARAPPRTQDSDEQRRHQRQQYRQYGRFRHSQAASAFTSYSHLMDSVEDSIDGSKSQRSSMSDASGGSPNLSEFKNIAINGTASPSQPHSYHISHARAGSEPTRTRTNYKPQANRSGSVTFSHQHQHQHQHQQQQRPPARTSRYLREIDRRNILRRIEQGEKQANLAKEYQVSRAAISNLKQRRNNRKHSDQRLVGHQDGYEEKREYPDETGRYLQLQLQHLSEEFARERVGFSTSSQVADRHRLQGGFVSCNVYSDERYDPANGRARSASPVSSPLESSPYHKIEFTSPQIEDTLDRVIEVKTATTELLFTRLIDQRVDAQTSQLAKSRLARLLLENAMSESPTRHIKVPMTLSAEPLSYFLGAEFTKPTCAVKILSDCGDQAAAAILLQQFQEIEPHSEVGSLAFTSDSPSSSLSRLRHGGECSVDLPENIRESSVLLLVDLLDSQSSDEVAKALQAILRSGVHQRDIHLVSLCSHERALRYLLELLPQLRIVTAKVLAQGDPSSSSIGDLLRPWLLFQ